MRTPRTRNLPLGMGHALALCVALAACSPSPATVGADDSLHSGAKATVTGTAAPATANAGETVNVALDVTVTQTTSVDVALKVLTPSGQSGYTAAWTGQSVQAGQKLVLTEPIVVDPTDADGKYTVAVTVKRTGGQVLTQDNSVTSFNILQASTDAGQPGPTDAGTPPQDAGTPPTDAGAPPTDAGHPPPPPPPPDAGVPGTDGGIKTVFIVMMENTDWSAVKGNRNAPYINNTLLPNFAHAENYRTYNHPSLPNYVTLEAGDNLGLTNGSYEPTTHSVSTTDHLTTYLNRAGHSWKYYAENLPGNGTTCNMADPGTPYSEDHNPFVYFDDVKNNPAYCIAHERPFTELGPDLSSNRVAEYNFIVPNDWDQGEKLAANSSCGLCQADTFLSHLIPQIQASAAYKDNGVILVLWDEGFNPGNNPSGLIVVSDLAKKGYANSIAYNHGSTVRTVEEIFNVSPFLRSAATATDLRDLFTRF